MPTTFNNFSAGSHTLKIQRREDGEKLYRVTLTASNGQIIRGAISSSSSSSSSYSSRSSSSSGSSGGRGFKRSFFN